MSRIYVHTPGGDAEVSGTERAWMGSLSSDVGTATVRYFMLAELDRRWAQVWLYGQRVRQLLVSSGNPDGMYSFELEDRARTAFHVGGRWRPGQDRTGVWVDDRYIYPRDLTMNTAMVVGSPTVQLATRVYWQCELHCWVDGPNRAWLAGLIEDGLRVGTFRHTPDRGYGWTDVVALLGAAEDAPAVFSSSYDAQFPCPPPADLTDDRYDEVMTAWADQSPDDQWAAGMTWLRAAPGLLELRPEDFGSPARRYVFGDVGGLTWLDFEHFDAEARVRAALGLDPAVVSA